MKHLLVSLAFILLTTFSFSQTSIKLEDISKHVGDSVIVTGKVADGRYLERSQNSPTFLNIGAAYPNQLLTLVIWKDQRGQFKEAPETTFLNREVIVTGKIELYRERPQIVIHSSNQIKLAQ